MAEYRYYLIQDAMTRAFPEQFEKQTSTEFFDNIADLEKRYHQLREMPSHLRCAAGRAAPAWASIWIVRALSNIAIGRRTCLFPQAVQPPIGM